MRWSSTSWLQWGFRFAECRLWGGHRCSDTWWLCVRHHPASCSLCSGHRRFTTCLLWSQGKAVWRWSNSGWPGHRHSTICWLFGWHHYHSSCLVCFPVTLQNTSAPLLLPHLSCPTEDSVISPPAMLLYTLWAFSVFCPVCLLIVFVFSWLWPWMFFFFFLNSNSKFSL